MRQNRLGTRLLKKVQPQGGTAKAERGVLVVRRSERRGGPTPQIDLFQQPVGKGAAIARVRDDQALSPHGVGGRAVAALRETFGRRIRTVHIGSEFRFTS